MPRNVLLTNIATINVEKITKSTGYLPFYQFQELSINLL